MVNIRVTRHPTYTFLRALRSGLVLRHQQIQEFFFMYIRIVFVLFFLTQVEYSYFSADFRLKRLL